MTDTTDILAKLAPEIKYKRRDSVWNHLLCIVRIDNDGYSGEIMSNGFSIWTYSPWTGVFYPVMHGTVETTNDHEVPIIRIRSRLNPVGRFLVIAMTLGIACILLDGVILQEDNSFPYFARRLLLGMLLFTIPCVAFYLVYNRIRNKEEERIKTMCQQWLPANP